MIFNRIKYSLLFVFVLAGVTHLVAQNEQTFQLAEEVFDKLYQVSGQFVLEKPKLEISKENRRVAAYHPRTNTVTIDEKALGICASMGAEGKNALAFLMGHELAHALQKGVRDQTEATHFLAYDKHLHSSSRVEKVADIQGVFTGYLAGFGMKKAIPVLLKKVYEEYKIDDSKLSNYPSFSEREATAKEVIKIASELESLFDANNYLVALGRYDLSIHALEYILEYYQGQEIQNNIGIAYLMYGSELIFDPEIDKYAFPLEIDDNSLLNKIDKSRGPLNYTQRKLRNSILNKGLEYLDRAIELDKNYFTGKLNRAIALNLLQRHEEALAYLNSNAFNSSNRNREDFKLALAVTQALSKNNSTATYALNELRNSQNSSIAWMADYNYQQIKQSNLELLFSSKTSVPKAIMDAAKACQMDRSTRWNKIALSTESELFFQFKESNGLTFYSFNDGFSDIFSIIISEKSLASNETITHPIASSINTGKNHYFIKSEDNSAFAKISKDGAVVEVGKFFNN